ncbi:helix-turn-helix transcriptional regulator [Mucilaginibacter sp. Bleaf8]|uniref:helix-turn-helix domain-containing protein n=1 Tax=Mucilaginibacter sp. Bleaf8 TaxID=2834430 RepID=UPI001BD16F56|nr:AraC family transcriptional regulator [Mucilaginibacter sp. Bleaf8]MBS7565041.1 helix-turn-helix transcriptional regulator [Mucilaginibacter sp. Bleaf8]
MNTEIKLPKKIMLRQREITADYLLALDKHLEDVVNGKVSDMLEIRDFADQMHIDARHLSNTIKLVTGKAPCFFFEEKIMNIARQQLTETDLPITAIATKLTYDPSNFVRFFKRFQGITPKQYREQVLSASLLPAKTETVTI